jgi:hypothetical protein
MTRKAVVFYDVDASSSQMQQACVDGIRECAAEALTHGASLTDVVAELEQVANDAECGELV